MNFAIILKAILVLVSIIVGIYLLSLAPKSSKGIDYRKVIAFVKRNPFRLIAVMLLLYAAYVTLLYNNTKRDLRKTMKESYSTMDEAAQCRIENSRLNERIDSLTQVLGSNR